MNNKEVLTGGQRIGNNIVDGQSADELRVRDGRLIEIVHARHRDGRLIEIVHARHRDAGREPTNPKPSNPKEGKVSPER